MTMGRRDNLRDQSRREIMPIGVVRLDQFDFPAPIPFLDVLLTLDRSGWVIAGFEVNQLLHGIAFGEAGNLRALMLGNAADEIVRDADIERPISIRSENVNVIGHRPR